MENLLLEYRFAPTPFGDVLVASTAKGICWVAFADKKKQAVEDLRKRFPKATVKKSTRGDQGDVLRALAGEKVADRAISLDLKGTAFELAVWRALRRIPFGRLATYGDIARRIRQPRACRAVGTAIGKNPIAMLIPCHRIVPSSGGVGNYHWGITRKAAMIRFEAVQSEGVRKRR